MKKNLDITLYFDPELELAVAEFSYGGKIHQTADIRNNTLVISKTTLVENMKYKICDDNSLDSGYTRITKSIPCEIGHEGVISYTYVICDYEIFNNIIASHKKEYSPIKITIDSNKLFKKTASKWDYTRNEIIDRISQLTVNCPECENIIHDDPQYQCGTCGGGSEIRVLDWVNNRIKESEIKPK